MSVVTAAPQSAAPLDVAAVREEFPILGHRDARGNRLAFLDSASSSQKPACVLDALDDHYRSANANIHRGRYHLSDLATRRYEDARVRVAALINAASPRECIFVRNTTEAINLVAHSWGRTNLRPGELVVGTTLDHHSNLVPWQIVAAERGARLAHVRLAPDGRLDLDHLDALLAQGPRLVAFCMTSNSIGSVTDAAEVVRRARAAGAVTVLDAAQAVPHEPVDVQALGCDFLAASGHKMLAPMGSGVLWGRLGLLDAMPPFMAGGGMVRKVELGAATWADVPERFEAGTPAVGEAVGLGVAADYLAGIGLDRIHEHGHRLAEATREALEAIPGVAVHGPTDPAARSAIVSFNLSGHDPLAVAEELDAENIAVRAGRHCCHPLFDALGLDGVIRASFYLYNDDEDADRLVTAIRRIAATRPSAPAAIDHANPCARPVHA